MALNFYPEDAPKPPPPYVDTLDYDQLRELRDQIDAKLPADSLKSLNLETELVTQYQRVLNLQDKVLRDSDVPANQRAQVAGQVASTLQHLIKMQIDLKRDEQLKRMEAALLKAVATLDDEAKLLFFNTYEQLALTEGVDVDG